jgi:hypothetical protein
MKSKHTLIFFFLDIISVHFYLCLGLPSGLLPSGTSSKFLMHLPSLSCILCVHKFYPSSICSMIICEYYYESSSKCIHMQQFYLHYCIFFLVSVFCLSNNLEFKTNVSLAKFRKCYFASVLIIQHRLFYLYKQHK